MRKFSLIVFCGLVIYCAAQSFDPTYIYHNCSNASTFTANSIYQSNLKDLLANLSSQANLGEEYYRIKVGDDSLATAVYGCYLCRGDVNETVCKDCVGFATKDASRRCPVEKQNVMWYDECMLRYSNQSFFDMVDVRPRVALLNTANVTDPVSFREKLEQIMNDSASEVNNGAKRFLTKEVNFSGFQTIYTLMQCTPDLSGADCTRCLRDAIAGLSICCSGRLGGRVLFPSCNVRYEFYPFYLLSTTPPAVVLPSPPPPSTTASTKKPPRTAESSPTTDLPADPGKSRTRLTVAGIIIVVIVVSLALGCGFFIYHKRVRSLKKYDVVRRENDNVESLEFDLITIETATKNFSKDYKLGEGGFGEVYKGILSEGQEIAVKRLSKSSGQGEEEFKNEVALVAKLQHRNLVKLLGFCLGGGETLLVYEFVPNKSLDYFLFDTETQGILDWSIRCQIISGIARGILYLHEDSRLRVIHRDLKASNVLLDGDMNPKISDFGMARMVGTDQTHGNTKRIVGT